jgi:hypothetical protein
MSNILVHIWHSHDPQMFQHLWIFPDGVTQAYRFRLGDLFPMEFDHEYLLEITPMLYKARTDALHLKSLNDVLTNGTLADLVEFPPFILKLLTNGSVVSLEALPGRIKP